MEPSTSFDLGYAALLVLGFVAAWKAWLARGPRLPVPCAGPSCRRIRTAARDRAPR